MNKWCKVIEAWCDDVDFATDGRMDCNRDCDSCDECLIIDKEVAKSERRGQN